MGDTTTLWVVELLELWRSSGDGELLAELYPIASRALQWLMANAAPLGLPEKLYSTYDILWLDAYNTTAYNSSTNPGGFQTSNDIVSFAYNNSQLVAGAYIQFATPIPFYNGLVVSAVGGGTPQYTLVYA